MELRSIGQCSGNTEPKNFVISHVPSQGLSGLWCCIVLW